MVASLQVGTKVEVRTGFDQSWSKGFEVAATLPEGGYRLRRLSDGAELPRDFPPEEVRRARRDNDMWWM